MNGLQKFIKVSAICLAIVLIANIFSWCIYAFVWAADESIFGLNKKGVTFEEVYKGIEVIEIEGSSSNIKIEEGVEFKVLAMDVNKKFSAKVRGNVLKIEESSNWFQSSNGDIFVTVPTDNVLKKLDIDTGAGKFEINGIEVEEFDMDHGAGVLKIQNSIFSDVDIDGGAGEILVNDTFIENLELDAGVGKVEIEANVTRNAKLNCGVGELKLTLLGEKENYKIKTEKGIGQIKVDGEEQDNHATYGNGSTVVELEGGVGSIEVSFK